jgi:hypothetical protein
MDFMMILCELEKACEFLDVSNFMRGRVSREELKLTTNYHVSSRKESEIFHQNMSHMTATRGI